MKLLPHAALLMLTLALTSLLAPLAAAQPTVEINSDNYAAIAFSSSTGQYGYAYDCGSLTRARRLALSYCKEPDAEVVSWVQFGWAVLVITEDNAYGQATVHGKGATAKMALESATAELRKVSNKPIKKTVIVCSGDVEPTIIVKE